MEIYDVTGAYGPWQRWVCLIFLYFSMVGMWQNLSITFLAPNVPFRCVEPSNPSFSNQSEQSFFDDSCHVMMYNNETLSDTAVPCTKWEYDTSQYGNTIVSEYDLVCSREWLVSLVKSVYMLGFLVSVVFFGQLSDWIGRYPAIAIAFVVTIASMMLTLLSTSYPMFAVLRFFQAFGRTGLTTVAYVLFMEIIGPEHRSSKGIVLQLGWTVGFVTLPALAWFVRDWFWLQLAMTVPFLPCVFAYRLIPESPRWLLIQGKLDKLEKLLIRVIKMNKIEIKGEVKDLEIFKTNQNNLDEKKSGTIIDILRLTRMRNRTFFMAYLWLVNAFMYYGLTYNTNDLAGNPYLNFLVAGVMEFPAYAVLFWAIKKYGRRPTLFAIMIGAGVSCAAVSLTPQPGSAHAWTGTVLSMIGKACVTASFGLLYLYTTELYPTVVRNVAVGSCSMCARVGSILAPFVRELGRATHPVVPNILYGVLAISSGALAFAFVPETSGRKLPDSLQEGERFGESIGEEKAKDVEKNQSRTSIENSNT